jgi:ATP-dependent helicase/nuclease subunit B
VPARWLIRLEMFLAGRGAALPEHPAVAWVRALDLPAGEPRPVAPPRPSPPAHARPRRLSVTEIETRLRDPYAIYAKHVLKLPVLAPLEEPTDAADYGSLVHAGLHRFLKEHGTGWPEEAADRLRDAMSRALAEAGLREALAAWWAPRLGRIADWVVETEMRRRAECPPETIATEASGVLVLPCAAGPFHLTGRADRIERRRDGSLAILDYKTGTPPSQADVEAGLAPQLLLEAAIAAAGGFGPEVAGTAGELVYWHLSGGFLPGEARALYRGDSQAILAAVAAARESLCRLIDDFDSPARCYISHPHPDWAPRFPVYAHLARVAEWSAAGDEG